MKSISALLTLGLMSSFALAQDRNMDKITVQVKKAPVAATLKAVFSHRAKYTLANDVKGKVTLDVKNMPMDTVVRNILMQVDATYTLENGIYHITRKEKPHPSR